LIREQGKSSGYDDDGRAQEKAKFSVKQGEGVSDAEIFPAAFDRGGQGSIFAIRGRATHDFSCSLGGRNFSGGGPSNHPSRHGRAGEKPELLFVFLLIRKRFYHNKVSIWERCSFYAHQPSNIIMMARLPQNLWTTDVVLLQLVVAACRCCSVAAQAATCPSATAVARSSLFGREFKTCPDVCHETTTCQQDCIYGALGAVVAGCTDGCVHEWVEGYKVGRTATTSVGEEVIGWFASFPLIIHNDEYIFKDGAVGTLSITYEATISEANDNDLVPKYGGRRENCIVTFNGNKCDCKQFICDSAKTNYGFTFDCSAFEGGSILNDCVDYTELTADSSLLEILYYTPRFDCRVPDESLAPAPGPVLPAAPTTKTPTAASTKGFPSAALPLRSVFWFQWTTFVAGTILVSLLMGAA
jgi:hypothetical protein